MMAINFAAFSPIVRNPWGNRESNMMQMCIRDRITRLRLSDLTVAPDYVFIGSDLGQRHRTASVKFLGGDTDLGSEAELSAIGKRGGRIHIYTRGVNLLKESILRRLILGNNSLAVMGGVIACLLYTSCSSPTLLS